MTQHITADEAKAELDADTRRYMYDTLSDFMGTKHYRAAIEAVVAMMVHDHDREYPVDTMGLTLAAHDIAQDVIEAGKDDAGTIADAIDNQDT